MNHRVPLAVFTMLLLATLPSCGARLRGKRPLSPEARQYIDTALVVVRTHALASDTVNWDSLREQTLLRAGGAQTTAETHDALQWLVSRVNRHSRLLLPSLWAEIEKAVHEQPPVPIGSELPNGVAYLALPSIASSDHDLDLGYARAAHRLIRKLAPAARCGWILDLRGNTGGNFYPMLLAAGPLLGEGPAGFSRAGVALISVWGYAGGHVWMDFDTTLSLTPRDTVAPVQRRPVALLLGGRTASAAEAVAISFRGVPNATSFGVPTAGLTTGNRGYRLNDGAYMMVTESVLGDRLAREYGGRLVPEHSAGLGWTNLTASRDDQTTAIAATWLSNQPGCPFRSDGR